MDRNLMSKTRECQQFREYSLDYNLATFVRFMTRLFNQEELQYDLEIERTARRLRKETSRQIATRSPLAFLQLWVQSRESDSEDEPKLVTNMNNNQTLTELATPDLNSQPLCIEFPDLTVAFESKSGLIHLLPAFCGLVLKDFSILTAYSAKDWLYYLLSGSINSWNEMKRLFLEKYFPASRAANIRKDICGIHQYDGESLYKYWERFKKLCASCPHHQINDQLLIQYFYEGLSHMDGSMVDAASGGALVDKTPDEARCVISNMAANS
ncbi:hypothetical protein FNV43_RR00101 [Rhamnella rubrinervis]|uniref:Retrotransposon gag domain-containing protein n=1 Tax=Rhamnella rubrinervis TaxID=2594499 RepID=A0A8K0HMF8_9ROSA|nr:hypothetical protein FNV43_RR00101 [Rhamnella rubrinervis]